MKATETERVIELFLADPSLFWDFTADVAGDPESYGVSMPSLEDGASGFAEVMGQAMSALVTHEPLLYEEFFGIDAAAVDWVVVWTEVERRAHEAGLPQ
jgi:hypothetical protein